MQTAICLICFKPHDEWIRFLASFTHYDIFVIIDDNSREYVSSNTAIRYAQVSHESCIGNGFLGINFLFHNPTGWEKALYYFTHVMKDYERVWFLEEDVFFYSEQTLSDIDKGAQGDLVSAPYKTSVDGKKDEDGDEWLWGKIRVAFEPPYYHGMVCASRMSRALLNAIDTYAKENKTLFFLEALFPTICHKEGLLHETPSQMETVLWKMDYDIATFTKDKVYHPVKDMEQHGVLRKRLSSSVSGMNGGGKTRRKRRRYKIRNVKGRYKMRSRRS